ncbi:ORF6N domain-containing protein [candidate division WOR-3 bacterium]|nr:ORF6N domain-containing protein [candidate division WOR-3 bacterium]
MDSAILALRGLKVMLDADLAAVYGVETKALVRAVKRNGERFPAGFMFQLTQDEFDRLRCQIGTSKGRGGRRHRPYAFTEHGAVMLAAVLKSRRAVEVSVFVVQAFVRMRKMLADQRQFALKLAELESKLASRDKSFQVVFDALRKLMQPPVPEPKKRRIGFGPDDNRTGSKSSFIARDRPPTKSARRRTRKP